MGEAVIRNVALCSYLQVPLCAFHVSSLAYLHELAVLALCRPGTQGFAGIFGAGPESGTMAVAFREMAEVILDSYDEAGGRKVEKVDADAKRKGQCHALGTLTFSEVSISRGIGGFILQEVADYVLI